MLKRECARTQQSLQKCRLTEKCGEGKSICVKERGLTGVLHRNMKAKSTGPEIQKERKCEAVSEIERQNKKRSSIHNHCFDLKPRDFYRGGPSQSRQGVDMRGVRGGGQGERGEKE